MSKPRSVSIPALTGRAPPVRIGFIPLVDCAPLLLAQHRDLFRKHGISVELSCEVGWATIREKLLYRQVDAAHAIAGLGLAMRLGLSTPPCEVVAPFVFNLHGNAITLSRDLWNRGVRDAATLKKLIRSTSSRRLTFGMVSRYASHHFLLRRWLASAGIDAEQSVRIVALPPTQMASNLASGLIDGYCAGEPWNSVAVEKGFGWIAATSEQLAPNHPEKVLLMNSSFLRTHQDQAAALVAALRDAAIFCDALENRPLVVRILADSGCFTGLEHALSNSLIGPFDPGTGSKLNAENFHIFSRRDANLPTEERGRWLLDEFIEHGLLKQEQRAKGMEALAACWTSAPLNNSSVLSPIKSARGAKRSGRAQQLPTA